MTETELEEENRKFMRNMNEQRQNYCRNRLDSGMSCRQCHYFGTKNCSDIKKAFCGERRY